ncbi:hypothetical protein WN944_016676 [Citrus x changshan-huyou]|uniref:Nucleolar protein 10 n=1 Tax=Citrus x changshan-huyou TaxID=2935761 RepID=A0AAP0M9S3_9ROSI
MYLQFYINDNGDKVYTTKLVKSYQTPWQLGSGDPIVKTRFQIDLKKESPTGMPAQSAHPARFSPDDKYSRQRVLLKKRFGLLPTQKPPPKY